MFAATRHLNIFARLENPEFQVWRGGGEGRAMVSQHSITNAVSRTGYLNVYEVTLYSPQPVQAGDYIGIFMPTRAVDHLLPVPVPVRPQWIEGRGPQYDKLVESFITGQPPSYDSSGRAIPLFAAILQGKQLLYSTSHVK